MLTGSQDKTARLWDASTGSPLGPPIILPDIVLNVAFSPNGKVILIGGGDSARLLDVATGKPIGPPMAHLGVVLAVAFSPDGKAVLTGSEDKTARLWGTRTGKPITVALTHQDGVQAVAFSRDGKTVLTGSSDKTARLWDAATGKPIGPPMFHHGEVRAAVFSPDGKTVLTGSADGTARLWPVPELPDDLPRDEDWAGVVTGLELDEHGFVHPLDNGTWRQHREQLDRKGGGSEFSGPHRLDPILFGPQPTSRARAWIERQRWAEAETAFDEAVLARPFNADVVLERARFHAAHSRPDKADDDFFRAVSLGSRDRKLIETILESESIFSRAITLYPQKHELWSARGSARARRQQWADAAADFEQAVLLVPENLGLRHVYILLLEAAGELDMFQRARTEMFDQFRRTGIAGASHFALWPVCSLALAIDAHVLEGRVRAFELAVEYEANSDLKAFYLTTLGAVLYRVGRFEDAIRRLDEGIQLKGGASVPLDWVFLAMAHHHLGHRDEAHRRLQSLSKYQPNLANPQWYKVLEIRHLRSEAEAVILYDPVFPADPFAH